MKFKGSPSLKLRRSRAAKIGEKGELWISDLRF